MPFRAYIFLRYRSKAVYPAKKGQKIKPSQPDNKALTCLAIIAHEGYVGLSLGVLFAQHHQVVAVDIVQAKVDMINNKKSPIQDDYIEKYLAEKDLNLTATLDAKAAYSDADFVVIAAPTNYDSKTQHFDTSAVEAVIKLVMEYNPNAIMVIKSTIPVGYTASVREKFNSKNMRFCRHWKAASESQTACPGIKKRSLLLSSGRCSRQCSRHTSMRMFW